MLSEWYYIQCIPFLHRVYMMTIESPHATVMSCSSLYTFMYSANDNDCNLKQLLPTIIYLHRRIASSMSTINLKLNTHSACRTGSMPLYDAEPACMTQSGGDVSVYISAEQFTRHNQCGYPDHAYSPSSSTIVTVARLGLTTTLIPLFSTNERWALNCSVFSSEKLSCVTGTLTTWRVTVALNTNSITLLV